MHESVDLPYRWLGYLADIVQRLPCYADSESILPAVKARMDLSGASPWMPPGYMEKDDGSCGVRGRWTETEVTTCADTWVTTSVFKYTEQEILARGHTAEVIKDQVCGQLKICQDMHMHLTWQREPGCMHVSVQSNPSPTPTPPLLSNGFMFVVTGLDLVWLAWAAYVNGPCFRMFVVWYASCPSLVCVGSWMMPGFRLLLRVNPDCSCCIQC